MSYPGFADSEALGESPAFLNFQSELSRVAVIDRSVMIIGERGTGKELAASRLHYLSGRWEAPLVTLNCAALSPSLIETELFGHTAGAYTGAGKARKGRFEEADGGTLFLDEIGLIPLEVQEKILRVVEYGSFERVGSSTTVEVDVRIVAATNEDMPRLCDENKFKRDLLDRLSFEVLFLPPLRERGDDILLLASHFAARMSRELGRAESPSFSPEVADRITSYNWPGNIRELKNVIERAVYKTDDGIIKKLTIDPFESPYKPGRQEVKEAPARFSGTEEEEPQQLPLSGFRDKIVETEISYLQRALREAGGNQKEAASLLGLTYDQFRGLYRKYKDRLTA